MARQCRMSIKGMTGPAGVQSLMQSIPNIIFWYMISNKYCVHIIDNIDIITLFTELYPLCSIAINNIPTKHTKQETKKPTMFAAPGISL